MLPYFRVFLLLFIYAGLCFKAEGFPSKLTSLTRGGEIIVPPPPADVSSTETSDQSDENKENEEDNDSSSSSETTLESSGPTFERNFLKDALLRNVLFTSLPEESLQGLLDTFEKVEYPENHVLLRQGDTGEDTEYVYVLYDGECTVTFNGEVIPPPYGALRPKAIFGELSVLYNKPRATTVTCKTRTVTLFRIHGDMLKKFLNQRVEPDDYKQSEAIENVIQEIEGTKSLYDGAIIRPYKPNRAWLWRCFTGTVLQHVAFPVVVNMLWASCFVLFVRHRTMPSEGLFSGIGLPPDPSHPFIVKLQMVHEIWSYLQGLTTFILTFFLNQAFGFWKDIYGIGRSIQGRMNDFNMILATTAVRGRDGTYTSKAEILLDEIGQYSRLFHALFWASCARRFRVLLTRQGLERMASRGLMTSQQLKVLLELDLPDNQRHNACLGWMILRADQAIRDGVLVSDPAHREMLFGKITDLRGTFSTIGDKLSGRMPLAYTHMVQVLVDAYIVLSPIALYSKLGAWSIICVGVLTVFYTGLLDLAKIFLDPLDNEDFCNNSIEMDIGVLIRESNAGSTRWKRGAARLPF